MKVLIRMPSTETFGIGVIWSSTKWVILFGEIECCRTNVCHGPQTSIVRGAARKYAVRREYP